MMRRPANVPRAAKYSLRDGWWQVGEVRDGKPFGPWRTWRPDGSQLFRARFDAKGRLQGTFLRFHPDGELAREARYEHGALTGQLVYHRAKGTAGDLFPSNDPRAWQVVIRFDDEHAEDSRTLLDERGRELDEREPEETPDESSGSLDAMFANAKPDGFLAAGFGGVLAALGTAPPATPDDFLMPAPTTPRRALDARRFQDLYGAPPTPLLRAWFETMTGSPRLLGVAPARANDLAAGGNLVEALIAEHQAAPGRTAGLRALSSGIVPIAVGSEALEYCYALGEAEHAGSDAIYPLLLDQDSLQPPVARSLDDFAYAIALTSAASGGEVSLRCLQKAYERLRGRVDLRPPMSAVEARAIDDAEDEEIVGEADKDHRAGFHFRRPQQNCRHFFFRCRWLVRLLSGWVESAARDFDPKFEGGLPDERFQRIKPFMREPHVAFYWLFRCHVFADPRLDELLHIAADAPAQLTRDAANLVRELAAGRKQLGAIEDWPALLAEFRALDPLSNKPEGEEEEAEEAEPLEIPEGLEAAGAILEWARKEGYSRENLLIYDELDCAALGLALRADPRIVPVIAELHASDSWRASRLLAPWLDRAEWGTRADLAAIAPLARDWLRDHESGALFRWLGGARVLARCGTPEDAALIADALDPMLDSMFGRGQGFSAALGSLETKKALMPMIEAMIALGVPESFIATLEGVVDADTHLVDDARGPCALALASTGRGLDKIVAGVTAQIAKDHGHRITAGQLLAIGQLGKSEPQARRDELIALIESIKRLGEDAPLGKPVALHDLGRPIDLAAALRDALAKKRYSADDTAKQRVLILGIIARRPDVPGELALPYVDTDELEVHRAAVVTLSARGVPVPPGFELWDPYRVNELAAQGRDAVHAALLDPARRGVHRGNLALWLGDHPDESSRDALIANALRLAAIADLPGEGPLHYELRWTVRAMLKVGGCEPILDQLLLSPNKHVSEPVLRYVDAVGPAVARGMTHIFVNDEHWRQSSAKDWLKQHKAEPVVVAALAEAGLAVEDISRTKDEDEDDDDDDDDEEDDDE